MNALADAPMQAGSSAINLTGYRGRRLRVFARLVTLRPYRSDDDGYALLSGGALLLAGIPEAPTYGAAAKLVQTNTAAAGKLAALPLQGRVTEFAQITNRGSNPDLPDALQDLADQVAWDVVDACAALDDPDCWYPGVDVGIAPVSDDHVRLVIAAMQRELDRELRDQHGRNVGRDNLPAVPLATLPFRVQRALVERRRLRFLEYGIGQAEWEQGTWSLWNVRDDPDWTPRTG